MSCWLSSVGQERPAEAGRRFGSGDLASRYDGERDDGHDIGHRRPELGRQEREAGRLGVKLERHEHAEKVSASQEPPGAPAGEHHQRERDPAPAGGHLLGPHRRDDHREIGSPDPRQRAAEGDRRIADRDHRIADRMGGKVVLADRAQDEPGARAVQEPADGEDHDQREIDERAIAEHDPPQRIAGEPIGKDGIERRHDHADITRADERREADAEDRER